MPHISCSGTQPMRLSISATASTCRGSPEWLAQSSAICGAENPNRSTPPPATKGSAWSGLSALRVVVGNSGSPAEKSSRPLGIDHGDRPVMNAFGRVAAADDGERRKGGHGGWDGGHDR